MPLTILTSKQVHENLSVRDLSSPEEGSHGMQILIDELIMAVENSWNCQIRIHRQSPIVSIADNYDRLHYPKDGVARDARYSRYVCDSALLRTHATAMIPSLLRTLSANKQLDTVLLCPGLVYRRDCIDKIHTGEPHQMDIWRISNTKTLQTSDLLGMIELVVHSLLPGRIYRTIPAVHPYTKNGLQIEIKEGTDWIEIGECGLALQAVLKESGLCEENVTGLAMGVGLDRIFMLRKGMEDIRLLRAKDPRICSQMLNLEPYQPVSSMPPVRRDISLVLIKGSTQEEIGDRIRLLLGKESVFLESVSEISESMYDSLPEHINERLGMTPKHKNVLIRIVLRSLERTLTNKECNQIRDRIYKHLHLGKQTEWSS